MKEVKIKLHSFVDVITNSSTVIYTNYNGCIGTIKSLVEEIFKIYNVDKTFDEVFTVYTHPEQDVLYDYISDNIDDLMEEAKENGEQLPPDINDLDYRETRNVLDAAVEDIIKQPAPNWYTRCCDYLDDRYSGNEIVLTAKDAQYEKLAELIIKTIDSADHDAQYDG